MALSNVNDPLGPSIFGDGVHSPGFFGGGQVGYNWQAPGSSLVWGIEADASLADFDGTNTCYAVSGTFTSFNCRTHTDAFGTAAGRVGWAFGPSGRALAYAKGGLAWEHGSENIVANDSLAPGISGGTSNTTLASVGWTGGAGVEYALTPHWSVKAEYDFLDFGGMDVTAPMSAVTNPTVGKTSGIILHAVPGTSVSEQIHALKLGMNYKFGPDFAPFPSAAVFPSGAVFPTPVAAGWEIEGGGRYWYSSGRFQKDLAPGLRGAQNPTSNLSRLTWDNLTANSGEGFARVDTPWNFFVKGFAGGGNINGGKINDEDWGLGSGFALVNTGYSNTVGNAFG
ncbi:MAG: outer membrane beta-barrel protein, partial [Alphaproteobacteria bacterium]|nr:outer membrane beta-barrel protein [Alphaproteobacteria bacterium]